MFRVTFAAYCGMRTIDEPSDDRGAARAIVAHVISRRRLAGYQVTTLARGEAWEVLEPDDSGMVPDACGTLRLRHQTYPCRECGSPAETPDGARECCLAREEQCDRGNCAA